MPRTACPSRNVSRTSIFPTRSGRFLRLQKDPDSVAVWMPFNGKGPALGQAFRNPDLAKTFRLMQQYGRDVFYKGEIAQAIVAKSNKLGGTMTLDDLANYHGEWQEGATTNYHGYDVWE